MVAVGAFDRDQSGLAEDGAEWRTIRMEGMTVMAAEAIPFVTFVLVAFGIFAAILAWQSIVSR